MTTATVAFVCVQNAGRSQMATAFAERENQQRGLDVTIVTGGTDPADHVHPEVIEVLDEVGIDVSNRSPKGITPEELQTGDYVITMGCGAEDVRPATWTGPARDWDLEDPDGQNLDAVRRTRDEIKTRVKQFFDELEDSS